ncbi:sugar phosphate isomerase/epimerase [Cesiribacter sp. SM1]|uniref:sugar phosphate isomerase/epimerase family protein n=1 Tax=Cesiribacter sp. SM1 TaxID=2861196 RepID=UPI001CD3E255|nr:sugar phosphate isomerase/epimerase family protein [Cesiribacter sp. SM1]
MKNILLLLLMSMAATASTAQEKTKIPDIGIVQDYENDSLLNAQGYRYLVESTQKIFSPAAVPEQEYRQHLEVLKRLRTPLLGSNLFIPGKLKVVGPQADEKAVLSYVSTVFQRAHAAGSRFIIWGSGGSRQVPAGFDRSTAKAQFVAMAKKVAALAKEYDITLALENLNSTEANFINTVAEALEVVKAVEHENFRLCLDIYHMLKEDESPSIIGQAKGYLVYCEVAEEEGRTAPGVHGEDFRPYFSALKSIGYQGPIVIECRWNNITAQGAEAQQYLRKQIDEAYRK